MGGGAGGRGGGEGDGPGTGGVSPGRGEGGGGSQDRGKEVGVQDREGMRRLVWGRNFINLGRIIIGG